MALYFLSTSIISLASWISEAGIEVKRFVVQPGDVTAFKRVLSVIKDTYDKMIREGHEVINAISHESTVKLLNELLDEDFVPNRNPVYLQEGDVAIALKPFGRPPAGKELTVDDLIALGLDVYIMKVVHAR